MKSLPQKERVRIAKKIDALEINPLPKGAKKLAGSRSTYRIRSGDYRIIYELQQKKLVILVVKIAHRRAIYRDY